MTDAILTPTEKLQATRKQVTQLSETLGKVVTYDDETTEKLLSEAERVAVEILKIRHDENHEDITDAVMYQLTGKDLYNPKKLMEKTLEEMRKFKVGDKVRNDIYGHGEVIELDFSTAQLLVHYFKRSLSYPNGFNKVTTPSEIEKI